MAEYSRADAANRSGVDLGYIDRLIELGVISPDSTDRLTKGDVRRAQMAQTLENAGIALDSLAASVKGGHGDLGFMDAPSYERFATLSDETFEGRSGGRAAARHSIRDAIVRGFVEYDYLRGDEPYKYSFGCNERRYPPSS